MTVRAPGKMGTIGIRLRLTASGVVTVAGIVPDSPADLSGMISLHDTLIAIDGVLLQGLDTRDGHGVRSVLRMLAGPVDSEVRVTFAKPAAGNATSPPAKAVGLSRYTVRLKRQQPSSHGEAEQEALLEYAALERAVSHRHAHMLQHTRTRVLRQWRISVQAKQVGRRWTERLLSLVHRMIQRRNQSRRLAVFQQHSLKSSQQHSDGASPGAAAGQSRGSGVTERPSGTLFLPVVNDMMLSPRGSKKRSELQLIRNDLVLSPRGSTARSSSSKRAGQEAGEADASSGKGVGQETDEVQWAVVPATAAGAEATRGLLAAAVKAEQEAEGAGEDRRERDRDLARLEAAATQAMASPRVAPAEIKTASQLVKVKAELMAEQDKSGRLQRELATAVGARDVLLAEQEALSAEVRRLTFECEHLRAVVSHKDKHADIESMRADAERERQAWERERAQARRDRSDELASLHKKIEAVQEELRQEREARERERASHAADLARAGADAAERVQQHRVEIDEARSALMTVEQERAALLVRLQHMDRHCEGLESMVDAVSAGLEEGKQALSQTSARVDARLATLFDDVQHVCALHRAAELARQETQAELSAALAEADLSAVRASQAEEARAARERQVQTRVEELQAEMEQQGAEMEQQRARLQEEHRLEVQEREQDSAKWRGRCERARVRYREMAVLTEVGRAMGSRMVFAFCEWRRWAALAQAQRTFDLHAQERERQCVEREEQGRRRNAAARDAEKQLWLEEQAQQEHAWARDRERLIGERARWESKWELLRNRHREALMVNEVGRILGSWLVFAFQEWKLLAKQSRLHSTSMSQLAERSAALQDALGETARTQSRLADSQNEVHHLRAQMTALHDKLMFSESLRMSLLLTQESLEEQLLSKRNKTGSPDARPGPAPPDLTTPTVHRDAVDVPPDEPLAPPPVHAQEVVAATMQLSQQPNIPHLSLTSLPCLADSDATHHRAAAPPPTPHTSTSSRVNSPPGASSLRVTPRMAHAARAVKVQMTLQLPFGFASETRTNNVERLKRELPPQLSVASGYTPSLRSPRRLPQTETTGRGLPAACFQVVDVIWAGAAAQGACEGEKGSLAVFASHQALAPENSPDPAIGEIVSLTKSAHATSSLSPRGGLSGAASKSRSPASVHSDAAASAAYSLTPAGSEDSDTAFIRAIERHEQAKLSAELSPLAPGSADGDGAGGRDGSGGKSSAAASAGAIEPSPRSGVHRAVEGVISGLNGAGDALKDALRLKLLPHSRSMPMTSAAHAPEDQEGGLAVRFSGDQSDAPLSDEWRDTIHLDLAQGGGQLDEHSQAPLSDEWRESHSARADDAGVQEVSVLVQISPDPLGFLSTEPVDVAMELHDLVVRRGVLPWTPLHNAPLIKCIVSLDLHAEQGGVGLVLERFDQNGLVVVAHVLPGGIRAH